MLMLRFEKRMGNTELTVENFMCALDEATETYNGIRKDVGKTPNMNRKEWIIAYGVALALRTLVFIRGMYQPVGKNPFQADDLMETAVKEMRELEEKFV